MLALVPEQLLTLKCYTYMYPSAFKILGLGALTLCIYSTCSESLGLKVVEDGGKPEDTGQGLPLKQCPNITIDCYSLSGGCRSERKM